MRFEYERSSGGLAVTAERYRDDRLERLVDAASGVLEWTFGAGSHGQTAVGRTNGRYFEHRVSYYAAPAKAAITLGHPLEPPRRARDLLGLRLDPEAAFQCFNCHATGVRFAPDGADLRNMTAGVQCERCHGAGARHVTAAKRDPSSGAAAILAGRGAAREVMTFCGECHRNPSPGATDGDPLDVRFQPIGLAQSRCFQESGRLTCTSCHDPHEGAARGPAAYVDTCLGCHPSSASEASGACGLARQQNCLPCHMPQTAPTAYLEFTDHRIRVTGGGHGR